MSRELFLFKRRSLWVAFFLFAVVLVSQSYEWWYLQRLAGEEDATRRERASSTVLSIQHAFSSHYQETRAKVERIATKSNLRRALSTGDDQRSLFSILQTLSIPSDFNVEVYDNRGSLRAWWGGTAELHDEVTNVSRETSFVSDGAVYSYLTFVTPVEYEGSPVGSLVARRLFDVNYPISNRFISNTAFSQTFTNRIDYKFSFHHSRQGGNSLEVPLFVGDDTLGYAILDARTPSAGLEGVSEITGSITRLALTALAILLFIGLVQALNSFPSAVLRILGISALIWSLRYVMVGLEVPSRYVSSGIFDPRFFASSFGFGIAQSIGELFITSAAGLSNVLYIVFQTLPRLDTEERRATSPRGLIRYTGVPLLLLVVVAYFLTHRGFSAVIRSAVFDSTLQYSDPVSVLPSFELSVMLLTLAVVATAFVLISVLGFLALYRLLGLWTIRSASRIAIVVLLLFVGGVLFGIVHPSPLSDPIPRLLVATAVVGVMFFIFFRRKGQSHSVQNLLTIPNLAVLTSVAVGILVGHLDGWAHQRERRNIQLLATDLLRPSDTWIKYVLEQTLSDMHRSNLLDAFTRDKLQTLAFRLWSTSLLSSVGSNCGVYVYDMNDHLVSTFRIGIRQTEYLPIRTMPAQTAPGGIVIAEQSGALGKGKTYVGSTVFVDERGVPIGSVDVAIVPSEHMLLSGTMPPFLQTYEREETERYLRTLLISEFVDGNLIYTTGEDIPGSLRLSEEVVDGLRQNDTFWTNETVGDGEYETLYVRAGSPPNTPRVLALGWKKPDWRWHVFDFVRYIVFYLIIFLVGVVFVFSFSRIRGRTVAFSFRAKLFFAFFFISLIPLFLIAYYNRTIAIERANQAIVDRLSKETALVRSRLMKVLTSGPFDLRGLRTISDERCEIIAEELGTEFSVYVGSEVFASSKSELFQAGFLDARLSAPAFLNVVLDRKKFYWENRMIGNYDYLVGYRPLEESIGDGESAVLAVPLLYSQVEISMDLARRNILLFGAYALVFVLVVAIGTLFANQISSPIRELIAATERIAKGELDFRLRSSRKDEIGELHRAFDEMTADLQRNRESLLRAERELAWREMAKQVAHEIKNPLTPVKLSIQHLRQAFRDNDKNFPQILEHVTKTVIEQIDTLSRIASQFAHFARMPERREENVAIQEVVAEAVKLFEEHKNVVIGVDYSPTPMVVRVDREELRRAFINIIRNAVQAMDEGGTLTIGMRSDGTMGHLTFTDAGPGIPSEVMPRLFEPNFSTKSEGMGMGLAIVKKSIDDLNGRIVIQSEVGKGTTVSISLPLVQV